MGLQGSWLQDSFSIISLLILLTYYNSSLSTSLSVPFLLALLYGSLYGVVNIYCLNAHLFSFPHSLPLAYRYQLIISIAELVSFYSETFNASA